MSDLPPWAKYALSVALGIVLAVLAKYGVTPAPVPVLPFAQPQPVVIVVGTAAAPPQVYAGDKCGCHAAESKAEAK